MQAFVYFRFDIVLYLHNHFLSLRLRIEKKAVQRFIISHRQETAIAQIWSINFNQRFISIRPLKTALQFISETDIFHKANTVLVRKLPFVAWWIFFLPRVCFATKAYTDTRSLKTNRLATEIFAVYLPLAPTCKQHRTPWSGVRECYQRRRYRFGGKEEQNYYQFAWTSSCY